MRKKFIPVILILCTILISGCATIFKGTSQNVSIKSNVPGAKIEIKSNTGVVVYQGETPSEVRLAKNLLVNSVVTISKTGYEDIHINLGDKIEGWFFGNCCLGGVVGMVIDGLAGSWKRTEIEAVNATLKTKTAYYNDGNNLIIKTHGKNDELTLYSMALNVQGENAVISIVEQ